MGIKNKEPKKLVEYPEMGKLYKHYKGGTYKVLTLAKHSETQEELVVYKNLGYGSIAARPLSMWFEKVERVEGLAGIGPKHVTRFTLIN